jgi:hypothetical protein
MLVYSLYRRLTVPNRCYDFAFTLKRPLQCVPEQNLVISNYDSWQVQRNILHNSFIGRVPYCWDAMRTRYTQANSDSARDDPGEVAISG